LIKLRPLRKNKNGRDLGLKARKMKISRKSQKNH